MKEKIITKIKCPCGHSHAPNSKVLANHIIKYNPQEKKREEIVSTFLDKEGKIIKVKNLIDEKETWLLEKKRENKSIRILAHSAIQKIAKVAGINSNYEVEESEHIIPKPENSMLNIVEVIIHCSAKTKNGGCVHDTQNYLRMTGEASKLNTGRGKDYLRTMAEKRGYDRAVLRHLGIEGVYSEEEAIAFEAEEQAKIDVINADDIESIHEHINSILAAKSKEDLEKVAMQIKEQMNNYNENQIQFLREQYSKANIKFIKEF